MQVVTDSQLRVNLTSSCGASFMSAHTFTKSITVGELKGKLELKTGILSASMKLQVFDSDDQELFHLNDNDERMIGSYQIDDGMRIYVTGQSVMESFGEIGGQVELANMSDEQYAKKDSTVRSFMMKRKIGKYNPDFQVKQKELEAKKAVDEKKWLAEIKVGSRCEVRVVGQLPKRGAVAYVGYTEFKPDLWVGVILDEPTGKNNGSVAGTKYFECPMKYGAFVRPKMMETGDFPELDLDDLDEM